ncbi:glycerate kinase [Vibrio sp. UCD-FRSSP16_10]|uniref:glycerate kinase n=1 Tax=unclassified Vibrio TaxID=2614977 RepID=UPI0007FF790A|nr:MULTISPECIES: glycerate kinase [unclassified Vibrio]OBT12056.1 glycerate kinase [Vibrio sp. UCD-FRSSP16_30]OBT20387.1 glycerate kinase [Vibrio sp. UCD-FRSSP16_10]
MKIVIAPDSFKGSLNANQVADCIEQGFSEIFPLAEYVKIPLADGGEGTVDVLLGALNGSKNEIETSDALGKPCRADWGQFTQVHNGMSTSCALIELAQASGLARLSAAERAPLQTSSFGTGLLIKAALDAGVEKIIMGLGGSATNDAGAGILQALGAKLLDEKGDELSVGGAQLGKLERIDLTHLHPRCKDVEFIVACDVSNPLCGLQGASVIFGPQKGATPEQVQTLDKALGHFADVASQHCGINSINHRQSAGFGAAGGTPLGLSLAFDIQLKVGIDMVLDILNVDEILKEADLLITGEGQMDNQTLQGKAPFGIAKRAQQYGIPSIAIAGSLGQDVDQLYGLMDSVFGSVRSPQHIEQVLCEAEANLIRTARNIAATLHLGQSLR